MHPRVSNIITKNCLSKTINRRVDVLNDMLANHPSRIAIGPKGPLPRKAGQALLKKRGELNRQTLTKSLAQRASKAPLLDKEG